MKTNLCFLLILSFVLPAFPQGSLTPPAAPTPTMKSLDQIASTGIAINATNTPGDGQTEFNITQPGSYYLTANLVVTKNYGIIVTASGVTIDLNGFQISRSSGGIWGIRIDNTAQGCTVKNGSISGFQQGINAAATRGGTLSQLTVTGTTISGLVVGNGWEIDGCKVHDCPGTGGASFGISTSTACTLRDCTVYNITGVVAIVVSTGSTLINCTVNANAINAGISAGDGSSLLNCAAALNTGNTGINCAQGCTLTNCAATHNTVVVGIGVSEGCALNNCVAHSNISSAASSYGIKAGFGQVSLVNCIAYNNQTLNGTTSSDTGVGIFAGDDSNVKDCVARNNDGDGIQLGNHCQITGSLSGGNGTAPDGFGISGGSDTTVATCTVQGNKNNGIQVVDRCQITGSISNGNGTGTTGSGIVGGIRTMVKNCTAADNRKSGIAVSGESVVLENHATHNGLGGAAAGIDTTLGSGTDSRVEGNRVRDNVGTGILGGSLDIIIRNLSGGNTTQYNPASGVNFGPIETPSTSTHPTANF